MTCTRCGGTGWLNTHQLPEALDGYDLDGVTAWLATTEGQESDVTVCDCCGDGGGWYGTPGRHYETAEDQPGNGGPYAHNGGLCQCH